jgi:hypothetical protein
MAKRAPDSRREMLEGLASKARERWPDVIPQASPTEATGEVDLTPKAADQDPGDNMTTVPPRSLENEAETGLPDAPIGAPVELLDDAAYFEALRDPHRRMAPPGPGWKILDPPKLPPRGVLESLHCAQQNRLLAEEQGTTNSIWRNGHCIAR